MKKLLLVVCLSVSSLLISEVVYLTPPTISEESLSLKMSAERAVRDGGVNLSLETVDSKTVLNCYGHPGGWTTLFGSVKKVIDLYEAASPSKDVPLQVIGSGCVGLTTAIELKRLGYQVTLTSKESFGHSDVTLASWNAGGIFEMGLPEGVSSEELADFTAILTHSFNVYKTIEEGTHPYLSKEVVRFLPVYIGPKVKLGFADMAKIGLIPPGRKVTIDFKNGVSHENYQAYSTFALDIVPIMKGLWKEVERLQIPLSTREITTFQDVDEAVIFNCIGLGANQVKGDPALHSATGHLIAFNEAAGTEHLDYMICTKVEQDGKQERVQLFPRHFAVDSLHPDGISIHGVIGGTHVSELSKLSQKEQEAISKKEFDKMLDRCSLFFSGRSYR